MTREEREDAILFFKQVAEKEVNNAKYSKLAIEALQTEQVSWIVGNNNAQVAVRNMPVDKLQKICAIIGDEVEPCDDAISREDVLMCLTGEWTESRDELISKAIRRLKQLPPVQPTVCIAKISFDDQQMKEMMDKAISNLDFSDLISRQAVLDELERCHITSGVKNQGTWNECVDSIMRTIGYMPSVQPELNCKSCVFRTGYGTGIDEGILNALPKK